MTPLSKFVRTLEQRLLGFQSRRSLLFAIPVGQWLRGYMFSSSAFGQGVFDIDVFCQPLFVPCAGVVLEFAQRIKCPLGYWSLTAHDASALLTAATETMRRPEYAKYLLIDTPSRFLEYWRHFPQVHSSYATETAAMCYAITSDFANAEALLVSIVEQMNSDGVRYAWMDQIIERCNTMLELVRCRNIAGIAATVETTVASSRQALGLMAAVR